MVAECRVSGREVEDRHEEKERVRRYQVGESHECLLSEEHWVLDAAKPMDLPGGRCAVSSVKRWRQAGTKRGCNRSSV